MLDYWWIRVGKRGIKTAAFSPPDKDGGAQFSNVIEECDGSSPRFI